MKRIWFPPSALTTMIVLFSFWRIIFTPPLTVVLAQQLTATPAPQGIYITVLSDEPFANIRMGPSSSIYPKVGILYPGDTALALGRSPGGDWIQIEYPGAPYDKGWVYSPLVQVSPGTLLVIEPPPTPMPPPSATIDPTLAAQYPIFVTSTRKPPFTPPPSMVVLQFTEPASATDDKTLSLGSVIISLLILGFFGFLLSLILRR